MRAHEPAAPEEEVEVVVDGERVGDGMGWDVERETWTGGQCDRQRGTRGGAHDACRRATDASVELILERAT